MKKTLLSALMLVGMAFGAHKAQNPVFAQVLCPFSFANQ